MTVAPVRLGDLAARLGRQVSGDPEICLMGVASLKSAVAGDLSFVRSPRYVEEMKRSKASALIIHESVECDTHAVIRSSNPALDFARAVQILLPGPRPAVGVHPQASVAASAAVHPTACVGAGARIGANCRIGAGTILHANVTLYDDVVIGENCLLHSGVIVRERSELGNRVILQPGVVVGGDGFGYTMNETGDFEKIPHVGRVVIEDDVEIGANSTIDRGALDETRIGRNVKIDNLVTVAHNCEIGEGSIIVAQSGLAGSTLVGKRVIMMAQAGAAGHLRIGDGAFLGVRTGVVRDVEPGARIWGFPALDQGVWHRAMISLARLPEAMRRLRALEKRVRSEAASDLDADRQDD